MTTGRHQEFQAGDEPRADERPYRAALFGRRIDDDAVDRLFHQRRRQAEFRRPVPGRVRTRHGDGPVRRQIAEIDERPAGSGSHGTSSRGDRAAAIDFETRVREDRRRPLVQNLGKRGRDVLLFGRTRQEARDAASQLRKLRSQEGVRRRVDAEDADPSPRRPPEFLFGEPQDPAFVGDLRVRDDEDVSGVGAFFGRDRKRLFERDAEFRSAVVPALQDKFGEFCDVLFRGRERDARIPLRDAVEDADGDTVTFRQPGKEAFHGPVGRLPFRPLHGPGVVDQQDDLTRLRRG